MAIFEGAGVALITPFKENGEVNFEKLEELVEEQIAGGTDAIIACGTTGESSTMTHEEDDEVIRFICKKVNHRIPVIAGTGSNCTREAVSKSIAAEKAGADGLLVVTPYYNKGPDPAFYHNCKRCFYSGYSVSHSRTYRRNHEAGDDCNALQRGSQYCRSERGQRRFLGNCRNYAPVWRRDRCLFRQ